MPTSSASRRLALAIACLGLAGVARAQFQVTLPANLDNTLYQEATGAVSNAKGQYLFTGNTLAGSLRRALLSFDVGGAIPAGSQITSVRVVLSMNMTIAAATPVHLHRCTASWGEGTSQALGNEGQGAPATTGDATWVHRSFNTSNWTTVGGDFAATASATQQVGGNGSYTWGPAAGLTADVQGWLDNPSTNFGWIVLGDELATTTAKRFGSREHLTASERPRLIVDFTPPPATVTPTGQGCTTSSTQPLTLSAVGLPTIPNPNFAWRAAGAPPSTGVVNVLGLGLLASPFPLNANCGLWLNPTAIFFQFAGVTDATGQATYPLPLPNNPQFLGFRFDAQAVGLDLGQPGGALVSSNALSMYLGR